MTSSELMYFTEMGIQLILWLSLPCIIGATVLGLLVALLQTLVQLQEQILGFAVKLTAIIAILSITQATMANELHLFMDMIFDKIVEI